MATQNTNLSIHPRNHYLVDSGAKRGSKVNTCAPRNDARKGALAKREEARSRRRTAMAVTMSDPKKAMAFKVPGSMKGFS